MRAVILIVAIGITLGASPVGMGTSRDYGAQITDPPHDVWFNGGIDIPEPSVDLLSVTFGRAAENLTVAIHVANLSYSVPGMVVDHKDYSAVFQSDSCQYVFVVASYSKGFGWAGTADCTDANLVTINATWLSIPRIDTEKNEITAEVPLSFVNGTVRSPTANTLVSYQNVPDTWPTASFQDAAPNCRATPTASFPITCPGGRDYDPYADSG